MSRRPGAASCLPRPARGVTGLAAVGAAPAWSGPDHDMNAAGSHAMALPPITARNRYSLSPATDRGAVRPPFAGDAPRSRPDLFSRP
jgi:hypothetical protein